MKVILWLSCGVLLMLAPILSATTVIQSVSSADGTPSNGKAIIQLSAACTSNGVMLSTTPIETFFTGGSFSTVLSANANLTTGDTCAGTFYTVRWSTCSNQIAATPGNPCPLRATNWTEKWTVPDGSSITVAGILAGGLASSQATWASIVGTWAGQTATWSTI
jgi:hypothetical protein